MFSISTSDGKRRALDALMHVLPRTAGVDVQVVGSPKSDRDSDVTINGTRVELKWAGEGWLHDVRPILGHVAEHVLIVAVSKMSPGARAKLEEAGISWVDETGAAEIVAGPIVISRSGRSSGRPYQLMRWTPAVQSVTEALLCGVEGTVAATRAATKLSSGSCTKALHFLAERKLLITDARRGPSSARRVQDFDGLLYAYATAISEEPSAMSIQVGAIWRDVVAGLTGAGHAWDSAGMRWACTGAVAASITAPYLSTVSTADVYVDAKTLSGLEAAARAAGLDPIEGGRLTLRPFPTTASFQLSTRKHGLRVVPWPRVYADLRAVGVRGEEAAEHLREQENAERERAKP